VALGRKKKGINGKDKSEFLFRHRFSILSFLSLNVLILKII
jgi:hypothetical protein